LFIVVVVIDVVVVVVVGGGIGVAGSAVSRLNETSHGVPPPAT
jgi:hypothetical protein